MKTSIIYARVSSSGSLESRQNTDRQVADLVDYATKCGWSIERVFEEHISGAKRNGERAVLTECINYAISNRIDVVLFSELSRCVWEVLETIKTLKDSNINAYFQKEGLSLFSADGKENPYLAVMVSVLGVCAQLERENIYYRLSSGRKMAIEKGIKMGRKVGSVKSMEQKQEQYSKVIRSLKAGKSIRDTAAICSVSVSTVQRVKKDFNI